MGARATLSTDCLCIREAHSAQAAAVLIAIGIIWMLGERIGLGRLPGDIIIEREGGRIYIPIATSLLISVVLSLLLWLFSR